MNVLSNERRVLTYGTFDPLTDNEEHFLGRLAAMGDRLIVGLTSDIWHKTQMVVQRSTFEERRQTLLASRHVAKVIPLDDEDQMRSDIVNYNVCLLALDRSRGGDFDHLGDLAQVLYLDRPHAALAVANDFTTALRA
jgi:glycerol-3-phosphate cytidylyltransferase